MRTSQGLPRNLLIAATVIVGALIAAPTIASAQNQQGNHRRVHVVPVNENAYGNTYGEWSARWWQWLLSIPEATNPNLDTTGADCAQKQTGPVWFLAGAFSSTTVTRSCTVPAGKALFFPIVNAIFGAAAGDCKPTNPGVECNIADLRISAAAAMDPVTLTASIDNKAVANLGQQRVQSPVLTITYPAGALFGLDAGTYAPNVSDGYWLMLPPLSAGTHTIHFKGIISDGPFVGTYDVTYELTVGS